MNKVKMPTPLDLASAFDEAPPPLDFAVPGLLAGTVGGIVAPGGAGKSILAVEMAMQIGCGVDLLGWGGEYPTGRVVVLSLEDPKIVLRHRLHAISRHLPDGARQLALEQVAIYDADATSERQIDLFRGRTEWLTELCAGARLVVIDTLRRCHTADENSTGEMSQVVDALERLSRDSGGATVIYLHHVSKGAATNGQGDQQHAARGTTVLVDHARWLAALQVMTPQEAGQLGVAELQRRHFVRLATPKQNYGEPSPDRWYRRHSGGVLRPAVLEPPKPPPRKNGAI